MNRIWTFSLIIVAIIIADQLTKGAVQSNFELGESVVVIDGLFNFTYVRNPGAAFGFLASAPASVRKPLFLFLPVLACFWLIWLIWTHRHKDFLSGLTYSLIFAGAVGNLIDRFLLGFVVDFFDFYIGKSHFPAFNIADSAISIGAVFLFFEFLKEYKKEREEKSKATEV